MENEVGMGKAFPTWGFPIPIPLNLLVDRVGNAIGLLIPPHPLHPIAVPMNYNKVMLYLLTLYTQLM